jgi:tetratricopeptide (TPR) repeat protein
MVFICPKFHFLETIAIPLIFSNFLNIFPFLQEISKGLKVWNKKEALKFFKKAIEFNPNNIDAHFFMGETLYKLKKVKEAYSFFNKAVELCPYEYLAYKIKGDSYKAIKNYDTAIKCYDKSIELNSSNILAYLEKADCFEKNEMFEKAIECFDTVIELFPQDYQGVKFKGELLQKLGRS